VAPVAFEFDGDAFWVGGNGESVLSEHGEPAGRRQLVPGARCHPPARHRRDSEQLKWGHPAYVHPDGVILFAFSAHKAHASFAVTPTTRAAFAADLIGYRTGKGTVALLYDVALPQSMLERMIEFRIREYEHHGIKWM
jgi:uncharacterized protein YdhG (YjbR/CyaY superfamily)